jgi:hypothetical protein
MKINYPREKAFSGYSVRVDRLPYTLRDDEKASLKSIFETVMVNLAFYARDTFVERLFETEYLIRIYDSTGEVVGFGNAANRDCGGIEVLHIMSIYVLPDFRGYRATDRALRMVVVDRAIERDYCRHQPMYFSASTVNLQLLYTSLKCYTIWPDLLYESPVPEDVRRIAEGANSHYPKPGDKLFQVKITEEFAGLRDGYGHDTKNIEFNQRFRALADPGKYELVFLVGRIDARQLSNYLMSGGNLRKRCAPEEVLTV